MAKKIKFEKEIPSVFSLLRGVEVSDAEIEGVEVFEHGGVTIKSHLTKEEKTQGVNNLEKVANLYYGQVAKTTKNEIKFNFNIKFNKFNDRLYQVNNVDYYNEFNKKVNIENEKIKEALEKNSRYIAYNLINGRWLWRNKFIAEKIKITIKNKETMEEITIDNVLDIENDIKLNEKNGIINEIDTDTLNKVSNWIFEGFKNGKTVLDVTAILKVEKYMNAYPSELFKPEKKKIGKLEFGKEFYITPDTRKPALTFEKVWNALRTYDVWYTLYKEIPEPLSIEFKGGSLKFQEAFRDEKNDFRFVLNKFMNDMELTDEEMLYFIGCLLRGGIIADEKDK